MPNLTLDEAKAALHTVNYDLGDENPEVFCRGILPRYFTQICIHIYTHIYIYIYR